ncbi:hypothetical protein C0081_13655 [Cohaesibacter celericrescens]|uniref:Radical SAM core domain-containing protein n=2 Tax=Cohaesibacter celericrescens TaxID=2067669 RepID=A0A2N5XQ66_9HYPH|nr:hypothetical protein C0081_13655 [Cohaesibacter celericrescens]
MPFLGLHVGTKGEISPCCEFDGEWGNVSNTVFNSARQSIQAVADRDAFIRGDGRSVRPCWKCFEQENAGGTSLRQKFNHDFAKFLPEHSESGGVLNELSSRSGPAYLDIRFSNLCNFKCRSCWHGSSSSWFKDAKDLGTNLGERAEIRSISSTAHLLEQIEPQLDSLRHVYFAGGEPLMIAENYRLLEILITRKRTDIELAYNTNGSVLELAKSSMLELWGHFPKVTVELSVDATRPEAASLIRSGFSFDIFTRNAMAIRMQCPHVKLRFGITVSALNLQELPRTLNDLRMSCGAGPGDFSIHALQSPNYMRPSVLPKKIKKRALAKLKDFVENIDPEWGNEDQRDELIKQIAGISGATDKKARRSHYFRLAETQKRLDTLRKENTLRVLPDVFPKNRFPQPDLFSVRLRGLYRRFRTLSSGE